jgi:hypothetical protein
MPRVHFVKAAAKDNEVAKKGEPYYWWKFRHGGKYMSLTPPRPSQLTQSKMSGVYEAQETMEDAIGSATSPSDIASALESCAEAVRDVAEEYRDSVQNMPESLQQGSVAQECEEKAYSLDDWAQSLDDAKDEIDNLDVAEYIDHDAVKEAAEKALKDEYSDPTQNDIDTKYATMIDEIAEFDDLDEETGAQAMLDAAIEIADGVSSCPL